MVFKHILSINVVVTSLVLLQTSGNAQQMFMDLLRNGLASNPLEQMATNLDTFDTETVTKKHERFLNDPVVAEGEPVPEPTAEELAAEEEKAKREKRVKDIKTTMAVLIGVISILTLIGVCCFVFSLNECNNKEPDSDAEEEYDYGDEEGEEAEEGEEGEGEEPIPTEVGEDFVAKIVIVGAKGVGKTLLWSRYSRGLIPKINIPTKSQSDDIFESKDVPLDDKEIKLLLWDTSGRPDEKDNIYELFKEKNGVVVMYDMQNPESYEIAKEWVADAKSKMRENIAITLLGNKSDVSEDKRKVSCDEVKEYAKTENIKFEEISALDGEMK